MLKLGATVGRRKISVALFGFAFALAMAGVPVSPSEARQRHVAHKPHHAHHRHARAPRRAAALSAKIAAIVVDANSGRTLYARKENELRHPASVTKVMTLYLLFEQLEQGRLRLDSQLPISAHAARQAPTKLGLRPGRTLSVDDAIKAIVTRSANDIAVAIAEAVGGDEEHFAELMTRKAQALGMSRTHFANASGLPDASQVTTAHDLAILGRAVQERFPRYYRYFAMRSFRYAGATIRNHNHLLDRVEGMDGIKTGYTRASGFNLLTSVKRDGRYIVAVVLGGASAPSRDRIMAGLIKDQIDQGSTVRTASAIVETGAGEAVAASESASKMALLPVLSRPSPAADPVRVASISPDVSFEKPRPAFVSGAAKPLPMNTGSSTANSANMDLDGSTARRPALTATVTPSTLRWTVGPAGVKNPRLDKMTTAKIEPARKMPEPPQPVAARGGWMIQIGATDDMDKATELLVRAKSKGAKALAAAEPFTEKVKKGSATLYRARFAGLQADSAELACKTLKRSGFACFAIKN
jgi:D-alanyl-D-alanine carboxypeptidase